jgi:hypothetical protein
MIFVKSLQTCFLLIVFLSHKRGKPMLLLSVDMLSVVMLSVIMLSVMAPNSKPHNGPRQKKRTKKEMEKEGITEMTNEGGADKVWPDLWPAL